jgi:NADPH:quinone reductase-like Zn-dependent oxidoreductase
VTTCGNVGGVDLPLTVFPFILRGVTLQGIDTAACPMPLKIAMWQKLADEWMPRDLESLVQAEASLEEMPHWIEEILQGRTKGRVVVRI